MVEETIHAPSAFAEVWGGRHRGLTIGLVLIVLGAAFEALAVATTLPITVRELGGLNLYGWAFSAFQLANMLGITLAGSETDRRGPALPFAFSGGLFVVGLLVAGTAPSMLVLILGRAIQGLGAGGISSVSYAVIGQLYPERLRPPMMAMIASAWVVPGLIGPAIAGILAEQVGWRWVFLGLVPLPLVATVSALPALRAHSRVASGPPAWSRIGASLQLAAGTTALVVGIGGLAWPLAVVLIGGGLALGLPALLRLLPPGTLLARRGLPAAVATAGLLNMSFFGAEAFLPLALKAVRSQPAAVAGIALTLATIGWTSGSWIQARFWPQGHRRTLSIVGLAMVAFAIAGITATLFPAVPVFVAPIAWGLGGLGMGFAFSTLSLVVLDTAATGESGSSAAALQLANVLGVALGAGLGGVLIGSGAEAATVSVAGLLTQNCVMIGLSVLGIITAWRMEQVKG